VVRGNGPQRQASQHCGSASSRLVSRGRNGGRTADDASLIVTVRARTKGRAPASAVVLHAGATKDPITLLAARRVQRAKY
jgi:hypothetical protein